MSAKTNASWGGRFKKGMAPSALAYSDSQHYDRKLYDQDIRASIAHARMLAKQGILQQEEAAAIVSGLREVAREIESGQFVWKPELEDVHMNIESRLTGLIGETGKKLHTGRSRNDQIGLSFRLFVSEKCALWQAACVNLCREIHALASRHKGAILPGCTHFQPAQPVSLAHHLLAYSGMFRRDAERIEDCQKRIRVSPLGAAALAGSTYPLDPRAVAAEVGFPAIYANSMDAVSDRDFVLEALFCASLIMEHLSRLCEELVIWANPAFAFISLPDEFSTGSSIMPQKKNPDMAELMRGKTGRVYGSLIALLTTMKSLPLSYNRDLQEDKEGFFDTDQTVLASLRLMAEMLHLMQFNTEAMKNACKRGYLNATELADYLAGKGIPFRDAHHITGAIVAFAEQNGKPLEDLSLDEFASFSPLIQNDIYAMLDYENCVARRETPGGTGPLSVEKQLADLADWLAAHSGEKA